MNCLLAYCSIWKLMHSKISFGSSILLCSTAGVFILFFFLQWLFIHSVHLIFPHSISKREYRRGMVSSKQGVSLLALICLAIRDFVYNLAQQKVRNAEALAFNKNTDSSRKSSLPNYKVIPVHFYGLIFFLSHMFPNTVLISCGDAFVKSQSFWFKELQK